MIVRHRLPGDARRQFRPHRDRARCWPLSTVPPSMWVIAQSRTSGAMKLGHSVANERTGIAAPLSTRILNVGRHSSLRPWRRGRHRSAGLERDLVDIELLRRGIAVQDDVSRRDDERPVAFRLRGEDAGAGQPQAPDALQAGGQCNGALQGQLRILRIVLDRPSLMAAAAGSHRKSPSTSSISIGT